MSKASDRFEIFLILFFSSIIILVVLFLTGVFHFKIPAGPPVKYGYINKQGHVEIDIEYDSVGDFHHGLATVKKDGQLFVIDRSGKKTGEQPFFYKIDSIPIAHQMFSKDEAGYLSLNHRYTALGIPQCGKALYRIRRRIQGSARPDGTHQFDFVYAYIDLHTPPAKPLVFEEAFPFSDSLALVRGPFEKSGKHKRPGRSWAFINAEGQYAVQPLYCDAHSFSEGLAAVAIYMVPH
jgi:hypothetical protein